MPVQFSLRRDFQDIAPFLDSGRTQADSEREALGFLPAPAYEEAARQKKLIILIASDGPHTEYAGHLLYGGIFPILRVRQISVAPKWRRHGNATMLLRALKAQGESEGYLSIVANVASDLSSANSFYESNGFTTQHLKAGGATRKRTINVKTLQLDTPSLFSMMTEPSSDLRELIRPRKRTVGVPLYAIDLNVFFDVIRNRPRSEDAGAVFEAALNHQIRLTATDEFVRELERKSLHRQQDPVLALARRIPNLPAQDPAVIDKLSPVVTELVLGGLARPITDNDRSDVTHLCHAIAAAAAGYITSDRNVLAARDRLMSKFALDVISLSEFVELLDLPSVMPTSSTKATKNFHISSTYGPEIDAFLASQGVRPTEFLEGPTSKCEKICVSDNDGIIGAALLNPTFALDRPSRSIVCVRQDHPYSSTVIDFLLSEQLRSCTKGNRCTITLLDIANHPITRRIALSHGYQSSKADLTCLSKVGLGHPVTLNSWDATKLAIERLGGMKILDQRPGYTKPLVEVTSPNGSKAQVQLFDLETLLSPTLFALPDRSAVIAPITRSFADALLDTSDQLSFLDVPEAQFLSRRTYFNTTRAANVMIRGSAIAFYESARSNGRGAIIALGRIVDVTTVTKENVPEIIQRAAVVENLSEITKGERVLATTFDNLLAMRQPVTINMLRDIGCFPASNLISATPITSQHFEAIVRAGFPDE